MKSPQLFHGLYDLLLICVNVGTHGPHAESSQAGAVRERNLRESSHVGSGSKDTVQKRECLANLVPASLDYMSNLNCRK